MQKMARILFSFTTITLLMHGLLYNAILFVNYEMNKQEITELFCINKDKPELNCNGSCHLMQQLKDREHREAEQINYQDFKIEAITQEEELCLDSFEFKSNSWFRAKTEKLLSAPHLIPSPPPDYCI